jgi:hypothetical protein
MIPEWKYIPAMNVIGLLRSQVIVILSPPPFRDQSADKLSS